MRTDVPDYVHNGISCDECGVCPIAGVRYKSTTTYDYDLCQDCKCLNHDNEQQHNTREQFVAFERPVSRADASKAGPTKVNRIYAGSAQDAEQQLKEGKNAHVAFFRFYGKTPTQTECRKVVEFINRYTFLTTINVCLFCLQNAETAFAAIATGLATNRHVKHLSLRLMPLWNQDTFFDTSSVQNLIETNTVLESLHIGHAFLRDDFYYYTSTNNNNNGSYYESEDKFAFDIFESLQKNRTLKTFRLETISSLSATTLESACRAAVRNPMLIRVFAKFQNDNNNNDNNKLLLLSMLTSFNRYQWMKRWTDISAKPEDRLKIMEEIIFCTSSSSNNNNNTAVNTSALFHLFRSFPEALTYTTTTTTAPAPAAVPSTTTTTTPMME
eukprot:scaffold1549_cov105-Cylindrotheca_fusiformis.AAC.4